MPNDPNSLDLTAEQARILLDYDPLTGKLFWKKRPRDMCSSEGQWRWWNTRWVGAPALDNLDRHGYLKGKIFGRVIRAHRAAWLISTGDWPEADIDHINGIRTDNRLENLRAVTRSQNRRNSKMSSNNTSGVTGVSWFSPTKKWAARITNKDGPKILGYFPCFAVAVRARRQAERENGFSARHGT